jgi:hypothetical protein
MSTFIKNRPFYCLKPKINDREQCLCKTCCNLQILCNALTHNNALLSRDQELHVSKILCNEDNIICYKRQCDECSSKVAHDPSRIMATHIPYLHWERVVNENGVASSECLEKKDSAITVARLFENSLSTYAMHRYRFVRQYREIGMVKRNLIEGDFAF